MILPLGIIIWICEQGSQWLFYWFMGFTSVIEDLIYEDI